MPLQLITGRATAGKTGQVNARVFESLERGESPILVLPSVADTRRSILEFSGKAPVGVAVIDFRRWADSLWRQYGDGRRIVQSAARDALVRRAIACTAVHSIDSVAQSSGFAALVARTVRAMNLEASVVPAASTALCDVERICVAYRQLVTGAGLVEAAEAYRSLGANPPTLGGTVAFNRFSDFTESEFALVTGLARVNEVVVAVTWEQGFAPTRALDETAARFSAVAQGITHVPDARADGELAVLLDGLYGSAGALCSTGEVHMGLAAGAEAEAALVASAVAEIVSSGTKPDRVAVAFPDLNASSGRLAAAFRAEALSFDIDVARPVAATALGRTLGALLTLSLGGGDRTTALAVLLGPHSDISPAIIAELDRGWRAWRITDPRRILGDVAKQGDSRLGQAAGLAFELGQSGIDASTGKKWQYLVELLLSAAATRTQDDGAATVRELAVRLEGDASAARAVVRAVGEMASVEGTPFSAGDVKEALRTIVAGGTAGERPGRVQITEMSRLRSRRFDAVVLGGLTAAEMPPARSDSLEDELRIAFASGPSDQGEEYARFAFYQAISRARHRLVLVRRDSDDRGLPVRPSVLWEEVVDAYRTPGDDVGEWPQAGPPLVRVGAADVARSAPVFTRGRREQRQLASEGRYTLAEPKRGELTNSGVLGELARADTFSATEIEAYLQCPYRWFYERAVRPEEIDTEVDARAVGTIAHGLLKAFYDELPRVLESRRVTEENSEEADRLLRRVIAETDVGVTANGLAEQLDIARAVRWVTAAVADDAYVLPGFVPTEHEMAFGGPDEASVSLGGVWFRGRIDRIDRSASAIFVTDYKSSRRVSGYEMFAEEGKIQPLVYALAARDASSLPVGGSVYRSLRSRQMRGFWQADLLGGPLAFGHEDDSVGAAAFDELVAQADERVSTAVAGIRAGRIPREPSDKKACGFCALRAQCAGAVQ